MKNSIAVLMGGLSDEREISFLTGKACFDALKKRGYRVKNLGAKGYFVKVEGLVILMISSCFFSFFLISLHAIHVPLG